MPIMMLLQCLVDTMFCRSVTVMKAWRMETTTVNHVAVGVGHVHGDGDAGDDDDASG